LSRHTLLASALSLPVQRETILESGSKPSGGDLTCKERSAHQIDAFRTG
jgi:hypothetical protein